jgi:hypothetical protein
MKALRQTVDLSAYPDLVVVYLGMTVNLLTGIKTLLGFGPQIGGVPVTVAAPRIFLINYS